MDPVRFDRLSKRVASWRFSRRRAIRSLGAAGVAGGLHALQRGEAAADCADLVKCYRGCLPEERSAGGFCGFIPKGDIPGGPVGMCWSWSSFTCDPCDGRSVEDLAAACNRGHSWCAGQCKVSVNF